jgi:pimeloyl-ACP methyl ester carboxylesterase
MDRRGSDVPIAMTERPPKLIFFPGLGADDRLFAPQRTAFPELIVPPWIPPRKSEGLASYAARLAETLPRDEALVLGGVSLGGMIAYEVARHVRPQAVILIASCHSREGLRLFYRAGGVFWPLIPSQVFSIAKISAQPFLRIFGRTSPEQQKTLVEMFREMDRSFMQWAVSAIVRWNPQPLAETPLFHIHGRRDRMIPARLVKPDILIPDGGHLINITHAKEVNAFIQRAVQQVHIDRT